MQMLNWQYQDAFPWLEVFYHASGDTVKIRVLHTSTAEDFVREARIAGLEARWVEVSCQLEVKHSTVTTEAVRSAWVYGSVWEKFSPVGIFWSLMQCQYCDFLSILH